MKKFILILIAVLMCTVNSFARFHHSHHSYHPAHHVVHHSSSHRKSSVAKRTTVYHHKPRAVYKRDNHGNLMLYFLVTRNTHTYRHGDVDYVRCPVCKKVFIMRGQKMCSTCYYGGKKH